MFLLKRQEIINKVDYPFFLNKKNKKNNNNIFFLKIRNFEGKCKNSEKWHLCSLENKRWNVLINMHVRLMTLGFILRTTSAH